MIQSKSNTSIIFPSGRVLLTLSSKLSVNLKVLQKTVGCHNIQKVIKHNNIISQESFHAIDLERYPIRDRRHYTTKPKNTSNKKPLHQSEDNVWHYDTIYKIGTAVEGIEYALIITGRTTPYDFAYSLTYLYNNSSLIATTKAFVAQLGQKRKRAYPDRNFKLITKIIM